jgi:tetratricopeptide (TPR) repeat protein
LDEAEILHQQALAGYEKTLDPDDTATLRIISNIETLYKTQGQLKEAETMYQRVLAGYENALDPDDYGI